MKVILLTLLFQIAVLPGCSTFKSFDDKRYLKVYYVPFSMSTESKLFESETRNLGTSYVSFFCTSEKVIIDEFVSLALSPANPPEEKIEDVAPYMVVDVVEGEGQVKKIVIGPSVFYKLDEEVFLMPIELKRWIENFIPPANFPIGNRENKCGDP